MSNCVEGTSKAERLLKSCPTIQAIRTLVVMSSLMMMTIIVANLSATKIWGPSWLPMDGGIFLFPMSYLLGDLLVEIYGRKIADYVAWMGCWVGLISIGVIFLVRLIPDYVGADNSGFLVIANTTGRIFFASVVGFLAGQLLNNYAFERIRKKQQRRHIDSYKWRAFASSALAHIPDILLFEPIAFLGRLSFHEFVKQAVLAYVAAVLIELFLLFFATQHLARWLVKRLKFQHGQRI